MFCEGSDNAVLVWSQLICVKSLDETVILAEQAAVNLYLLFRI